MNYLIYIEHAAENLQFFLWYRDYVQRFSALPDGERGLAPVWTVEQAEAEAMGNQNNANVSKAVSAETAAVFKGTDFAPPMSCVVEMKGNPFSTPSLTPTNEFSHSDLGWNDNASSVNGSYKSSYKKKAAGAFEAADLKLQPCKLNHAFSGLFSCADQHSSHDPAFPWRDFSHYLDLHRRWSSPPAQSLIQGTLGSSARLGSYHSPICFPRCTSHCRMVFTSSSSPQLHSLDNLQR